MTRDCARVLELLPDPLPRELAEHVRGCPHCTAAVESLSLLRRGAPPAGGSVGLPPPPMDPLLLREAVSAGKARPWWIEAALAMVLLLATAGGAVAALGMRQQQGHPLMGWTTAVVLLLLIAVGTWSALAPRARRLRWVSVGLAALAAVLIVVGATGEGAGRPFWHAGLPCLATELGATLPLLAVLLWLLTRSAPGTLKVVAGALSGGAAGIFALHLHCPVSTVSHLIVFHLLPWAVLAAVALWARRWLGTRSWAP